MDEMRELFVHELKRMRLALNITKSEYAKRDFNKAIRNMEHELAEYDRLHAEAGNRDTLMGA